MKIYKNLSPDNGQGGGGNSQPSLDDLMNPDEDIIPFKDEVKEDDDNDDDPFNNPDLLNKDKDKEDKKDLDPKLELKVEVDPKLPEVKKEEKKDVDPDPEDKGEGDDIKPLPFWNEVEKITGETVEVDFGDAEMDTPEGAAKYITAYRDKGIDDFENNLKRLYPREWQALEMAHEGLDPSSLFQNQEAIDYTKMKLDETKPEDLRRIYGESLRAKGNSAEDIADLVKVAEDKGALVLRAKAGLGELQTAQNDRERAKIEKASKEVNDRQLAINGMIGLIRDPLAKGDLGNFTIPEKERGPLLNQIVDKLRLVDGKFQIVEEISNENIIAKLQAEYFKMKKGDLSALVERKAKTQNVQRLKTKIAQAEAKKPSGEGGKQNNNLSLQDLTED